MLRSELEPCATAMASIEENKWLDSGARRQEGPLFLAAVELELELERRQGEPGSILWRGQRLGGRDLPAHNIKHRLGTSDSISAANACRCWAYAADDCEDKRPRIGLASRAASWTWRRKSETASGGRGGPQGHLTWRAIGECQEGGRQAARGGQEGLGDLEAARAQVFELEETNAALNASRRWRCLPRSASSRLKSWTRRQAWEGRHRRRLAQSGDAMAKQKRMATWGGGGRLRSVRSSDDACVGGDLEEQLAAVQRERKQLQLQVLGQDSAALEQLRFELGAGG